MFEGYGSITVLTALYWHIANLHKVLSPSFYRINCAAYVRSCVPSCESKEVLPFSFCLLYNGLKFFSREPPLPSLTAVSCIFLAIALAYHHPSLALSAPFLYCAFRFSYLCFNTALPGDFMHLIHASCFILDTHTHTCTYTQASTISHTFVVSSVHPLSSWGFLSYIAPCTVYCVYFISSTMNHPPPTSFLHPVHSEVHGGSYGLSGGGVSGSGWHSSGGRANVKEVHYL